MKIAAIVQARTGSTRFPNKVFADLEGKPIIWHIFNRLSYSKYISNFILATTTNENDKRLVDWAKSNEIQYFQGSELDVLKRYFDASLAFEVDVIVRITADDPFKDPQIIDSVIEMFLAEQLEFAYNNFPPSFPEGLDSEVFSFEALKLANSNASDPFEREHVTQYFYRNPAFFKQNNLLYKENISNLRLTIDTELDYLLAKEIYRHLYSPEKPFLLKDILDFFSANPGISNLNKNVKRSAMYDNK